jgi:cobyrinic acid a,c-diamide synthase
MMASLRGGSGKTVLSMGVLAAWKARGHKALPFKKGPDYIDAGWLAVAAGHPCFNLDPYLMGKTTILHSFQRRSQGGDVSLIEGNRGLFDGIDPQGTYSTAELAKSLKTPLVLIVDCTKSTRTVAAMILGCRHFDPDLDIQGIILNHIAGTRHEKVIHKAVEEYCDLPILGAIPRMPSSHFPERHLGLLPFQEHPEVGKAVLSAQKMAEGNLDLDRLLALALAAPAMKSYTLPKVHHKKTGSSLINPSIGIIQDQAFQFYYPENLEALEKAGAKLIFLNALTGDFPASIDGLYIGGGFPETHAPLLAKNKSFRSAVKEAIDEGLPVYAECGGLMYLGKSLFYQAETHPMVGVLPVNFILEKKPQGHGYTQIKVREKNPFFPVGKVIKGHEFHYSRIIDRDSCGISPVFKMIKGFGLDGAGDGIVYKNVLATYTHLHALGTPEWAPALVEQAQKHGLRSTRGVILTDEGRLNRLSSAHPQ